jgi:hypothetical protein
MAIKQVEINCKEECINVLGQFNEEIEKLGAEMEKT